MSGIGNFLGSLLNGDYDNYGENENRKNALNEVVGEIIIDTAFTPDTNKYETGINRGEWIIVEEYESKEKSEKGHRKWVEKIKKNPKCKLKEVGFENWI